MAKVADFKYFSLECQGKGLGLRMCRKGQELKVVSFLVFDHP